MRLVSGIVFAEQPPADAMSLPEAAEYLGLHRATVNDMVLQEQFTARIRVGAHWFLTRREVEEFGSSYRRPRNARWPSRSTEELSHGERLVLDALYTLGFGTPRKLSEVVDLHEGNVRKHLRRLGDRQLAHRDERGVWVPRESSSFP